MCVCVSVGEREREREGERERAGVAVVWHGGVRGFERGEEETRRRL